MAGGSLMNKAFRLKLDSLVQLCCLDRALLVNKRTVSEDLVRCAIGVLYGDLMMLTVPRSLHQGAAAVGLQMRQEDVKAKKDVSPTCVIPMQTGDRLRLVCNPSYGHDKISKREPLKKIRYKYLDQRSYDLIERLPINTGNGPHEGRMDFARGETEWRWPSASSWIPRRN
ncbi:hypothetical protein QR685DRAFT_547962 [Neurospora intermedia]|uniref:Uncharacterized protein n=1 Tax=Neurospora intermedia TaxID=5142 RepID=A0ABR3D0Z8_NEUIN